MCRCCQMLAKGPCAILALVQLEPPKNTADKCNCVWVSEPIKDQWWTAQVCLHCLKEHYQLSLDGKTIRSSLGECLNISHQLVANEKK